MIDLAVAGGGEGGGYRLMLGGCFGMVFEERRVLLSMMID